MHRFTVFTVALVGLLLLRPANAQRAILQLDTTSDNDCSRIFHGGVWKLHDASPRNNQRPEVYVLKVSLQRIPVLGSYPREIVEYLPAQGTIVLGCNAGPDGANYQIISEEHAFLFIPPSNTYKFRLDRNIFG